MPEGGTVTWMPTPAIGPSDLPTTRPSLTMSTSIGSPLSSGSALPRNERSCTCTGTVLPETAEAGAVNRPPSLSLDGPVLAGTSPHVGSVEG